MYTKTIQFQKFIPSLNVWVNDFLRVTDDSLWLHFQALSLNDNVRSIYISDL